MLWPFTARRPQNQKGAVGPTIAEADEDINLGLSPECVKILKKTLFHFSKVYSDLRNYNAFIVNWDVEDLPEPPDDVSPVLPPESWPEPDFIVFGLQNCSVESVPLWKLVCDHSVLQFNNEFVAVTVEPAVNEKGGNVIFVYARRDLVKFICGIDCSTLNGTDYHVVAFRFGFHQSSFCFINATLSTQFSLEPKEEDTGNFVHVKSEDVDSQSIVDSNHRLLQEALAKQRCATICQRLRFNVAGRLVSLAEHPLIVWLGTKDYDARVRKEEFVATKKFADRILSYVQPTADPQQPLPTNGSGQSAFDILGSPENSFLTPFPLLRKLSSLDIRFSRRIPKIGGSCIQFANPTGSYYSKVKDDVAVLKAGVMKLILEVLEGDKSGNNSRISSPEVVLLQTQVASVEATSLKNLYVDIWRTLKDIHGPAPGLPTVSRDIVAAERSPVAGTSTVIKKTFVTDVEHFKNDNSLCELRPPSIRIDRISPLIAFEFSFKIFNKCPNGVPLVFTIMCNSGSETVPISRHSFLHQSKIVQKNQARTHGSQRGDNPLMTARSIAASREQGGMHGTSSVSSTQNKKPNGVQDLQKRITALRKKAGKQFVAAVKTSSAATENAAMGLTTSRAASPGKQTSPGPTENATPPNSSRKQTSPTSAETPTEQPTASTKEDPEQLIDVDSKKKESKNSKGGWKIGTPNLLGKKKQKTTAPATSTASPVSGSTTSTTVPDIVSTATGDESSTRTCPPSTLSSRTKSGDMQKDEQASAQKKKGRGFKLFNRKRGGTNDKKSGDTCGADFEGGANASSQEMCDTASIVDDVSERCETMSHLSGSNIELKDDDIVLQEEPDLTRQITDPPTSPEDDDTPVVTLTEPIESVGAASERSVTADESQPPLQSARSLVPELKLKGGVVIPKIKTNQLSPNEIKPPPLEITKWMLVDPPDGVVLAGTEITITATVHVMAGIIHEEQMAGTNLIVRIENTTKDIILPIEGPIKLVPSMFALSSAQLQSLNAKPLLNSDSNKDENDETQDESSGLSTTATPSDIKSIVNAATDAQLKQGALPMPKEIWRLLSFVHLKLVYDLDPNHASLPPSWINPVLPDPKFVSQSVTTPAYSSKWFFLPVFLQRASRTWETTDPQIRLEMKRITKCIEQNIQIPPDVSVEAALRVLEKWASALPVPLVPREYVTEVNDEADDIQSDGPQGLDHQSSNKFIGQKPTTHFLCRATLLSLPMASRNLLLCLAALFRQLLVFHAATAPYLLSSSMILDGSTPNSVNCCPDEAPTMHQVIPPEVRTLVCELLTVRHLYCMEELVNTVKASTESASTPEVAGLTPEQVTSLKRMVGRIGSAVVDKSELAILRMAMCEWSVRFLMRDTPINLAIPFFSHFLQLE